MLNETHTELMIANWNIDRKMHFEEPSDGAVVYCYLEELFEFLGVEGEDGKRLAKNYTRFMLQEAEARDAKATEAQKIDAICDMNVYGDGFILRKGHHPVIAMIETIKEINTREGTFSEADGKWKKDKTDAAKAKWYYADREVSKIENFEVFNNSNGN